MTYVVTGSEGFIGQNLRRELSRRGHVVARIPSLDMAIKWFGYAGPSNLNGVFHLGAISDTRCTDLRALMDHNVNSTDQIYQWCAWNKVPLVYASSAATYGNGRCLDTDALSDLNTMVPSNAYAWSKAEADVRVVRLHQTGIHPPRWYGVKPFNVYGRAEKLKGEMASFAYKTYQTVLKGEEPLVFYWQQEPTRDFVHVDDVVDAMIWLMESQAQSGIYNLGTGDACTFTQIAALVIDELLELRAIQNVPMIRRAAMTPAMADGYQWRSKAEMNKLRGAGFPGTFRSPQEGVRSYVRELMR